MLSNYGFEDASGAYYIRINTDRCCECGEKPCLQACPAGLFEKILDDYDDEVVQIREEARNQLRQKCVVCKNEDLARQPDGSPACIKSCPCHAIEHTW